MTGPSVSVLGSVFLRRWLYGSRSRRESFREEILEPALNYHPGTAGSSLKAAYASESILYFITDYRIHLEDQETVNRLMADAFSLLAEEEREQLKETFPDLMALIDETIEIFPENRGIYEDTGSVCLIDNAMLYKRAGDDWERLKTAIEPVTNTTA